DLQVLFEAEQGGDRPPDEVLVVGQHDADHVFAPCRSSGSVRMPRRAGSTARSRKPSAPLGAADRVPPAAATRSASPVRPLPGAAPAAPAAPSLYTSATTAPPSRRSTIRHRAAALCRMTLVPASRTSQATRSRRSSG